MDIDKAILSHRNWKERLRPYLANPDGSLSASEIAQDQRCELGKWIAEAGKTHGNAPEFQTLRSEHARFHKAAAAVVEKANGGHSVGEETLLGSHSEFASASSAVVSALMAWKTKMGARVPVAK
jgi:Chemoreceptor zinc-binding domain